VRIRILVCFFLDRSATAWWHDSRIARDPQQTVATIVELDRRGMVDRAHVVGGVLVLAIAIAWPRRRANQRS